MFPRICPCLDLAIKFPNYVEFMKVFFIINWKPSHRASYHTGFQKYLYQAEHGVAFCVFALVADTWPPGAMGHGHLLDEQAGGNERSIQFSNIDVTFVKVVKKTFQSLS